MLIVLFKATQSIWEKQVFCCFLTLVSPREVQTLEAGSYGALHTTSRLFSQAPLPLLLDPVAVFLTFTYL